MASAFFISETYLKDNSPLSGNVDIKELYPFAKTAEDIYIQEAIGTCLYDHLISTLTASPPNYNSDEMELMKKIRAALVWFTCYDALPFIGTKIRNIGVVQQTGENLSSASDLKEAALRKEIKNKADFYLKRLQDYLCANSTLFPQYNCSCSSCANIQPNVNVSNSCDLAFDNDLTNNDINTRFIRKWLNS